MRQHQRMLCRIANRRAYHPNFGRRFDALVVQRKSWGYWFVARVAGMPAHPALFSVNATYDEWSAAYDRLVMNAMLSVYIDAKAPE